MVKCQKHIRFTWDKSTTNIWEHTTYEFNTETMKIVFKLIGSLCFVIPSSKNYIGNELCFFKIQCGGYFTRNVDKLGWVKDIQEQSYNTANKNIF